MNETKIRWEDGVPVSEEFDDVYFSKENGLEESRYVFLQGNKLEERWKNNNSNFTIIETGFGTGLNLLTSSLLWNKHNKNSGLLHYISIEKHPLAKEVIYKSNSDRESFTTILQELIEEYDSKTSSAIEIKLKSQNILITLMFEDINTALPKIKTKADAWFLDGFSPSKNPGMWTDNLYQEMARLSKEKTTFSTFTSAGLVKRGLANNGFAVEKAKGFGKKRDMLTGHFHEKTQ